MVDKEGSIAVLIEVLQNQRYVSDVKCYTEANKTIVSAVFEINMGTKAKVAGISHTGVKVQETVSFYLPTGFPLKAPIVKLRNEFPRNFPHLNPSEDGEVLPCVYEGDVNELYQDGNGPLLFIRQTKDWIDKAASNMLMDPEQGWEPMRADNRYGSIIISSAELDQIRTDFKNTLEDSDAVKSPITYDINNDYIKASRYKGDTHAYNIVFSTTKVIDKYIPLSVKKLSDLILLFKKYGLTNLEELLNISYNLKREEKPAILFVTLAVERPYRLINPHHESKYEYLFFAIFCKSKGKKKDKLYVDSGVSPLYQIESISTPLLQMFSGKSLNRSNLLFVGCGSLGSKIALHLAKAGCDNFTLIDPDLFFPHNNTRHGVVTDIQVHKSFLLEFYLKKLQRNAVSHPESIFVQELENISPDTLLIDTTASLAVRSYLAKPKLSCPVISTALYNHGRMAVILIEDKNRNTKIDDLSAYCNVLAMENEEFSEHYFAEHIDIQRVGIGCSSYTVVCSDADISLSSAGIANKVHDIASHGSPEEAEIWYGILTDNGMGINWKSVKVGSIVSMTPKKDEEMEIRLFDNIAKQMISEFEEHSPNETGGVLVGYISLPRQIIYVTSLIEAPEDSKRSPQYFELGTNGLSEKISALKYPLQALGTWHTHPMGGGPSLQDKSTKKIIEDATGKRTSCCLIVTKEGFTSF